jgi:Zn-dependent protease
MQYVEDPPRGPRLFGVAVNIDPSWLMFALFIGWQVKSEVQALPMLIGFATVVLVVLGLSLSILLHELSHTLTGRAFGMQIDRITLYMFGGVAELRHEPRTAISELLMALAGPVMSVVLAVLLWLLDPLLISMRAPIETIIAARLLAELNLALAIFNMVPAFPMDGGRVLRSLIWLFTGRVGMATRVAAWLGQGFGWLLMAWGAYDALFQQQFTSGIWRIVLGLMLARMAAAGRRAAPQD